MRARTSSLSVLDAGQTPGNGKGSAPPLFAALTFHLLCLQRASRGPSLVKLASNGGDSPAVVARGFRRKTSKHNRHFHFAKRHCARATGGFSLRSPLSPALQLAPPLATHVTTSVIFHWVETTNQVFQSVDVMLFAIPFVPHVIFFCFVFNRKWSSLAGSCTNPNPSRCCCSISLKTLSPGWFLPSLQTPCSLRLFPPDGAVGPATHSQ